MLKHHLLSLTLLSLFAVFVDTTFAFSSSSPSTVKAPRLRFQKLDESKFRHPLDRDLTSFIRKAPLVNVAEEGIRRVVKVLEQGVRLDLLSSSVKVSENQLPELHAALVEACEILGLTDTVTPELYVQSSPQANAYTLALQTGQGDKPTAPIVVVTSALLDRCTDDEIQAIIGHELGHVKCEHALYLTLGNLASQPLRNLPFVGRQTESVLEQWRLAAEYSCDRAAMLVAQDVNIVNGAMLKLTSGTAKTVNTQAFVAQCKEYDSLLRSANPLVKMSIEMQQRTHPLPVKRVVELDKWSKSREYKSIVKSGTALNVANKAGLSKKEQNVINKNKPKEISREKLSEEEKKEKFQRNLLAERLSS